MVVMMTPATTRAAAAAARTWTSPRWTGRPTRGDRRYQFVVVVLQHAAAGDALKGRIVLVHHDAPGTFAKGAVVLGLEAGNVLFEIGDRVGCAAAYAGTAEDDHAAHGEWKGWDAMRCVALRCVALPGLKFCVIVLMSSLVWLVRVLLYFWGVLL